MLTILFKSLITFLCAMTLGCASPPSAAAAQQPEALYGIDFDDDSVVLIVASTGCTKKKDFNLAVEKVDNDDAFDLTVYRIQPDRCRMLPHPVRIEFSRAALGISDSANLIVRNQFRPAKFVKRPPK